MADLASGRYPDSEEEWLLDGQPYPPYRRTISRRDITTGTGGATSGTTLLMSVFAVPVQVGDIFSFVSFLAGTAGATLTHSWVAIYNGVGTGAALLAQVADNTTATGWATGLQKLSLASAVANIGTVGTPQGGGSAAIVPNGAAVWGVAIYQSGTTLNKYDGMLGGSQTTGLTGQVPLFSTAASLAATGTAPAVLPTMTAAAGPIPYIALSRQ
jgi:hypothetical protein